MAAKAVMGITRVDDYLRDRINEYEKEGAGCVHRLLARSKEKSK